MAGEDIKRKSRRRDTESAGRARKSHKRIRKHDTAAENTAATSTRPADADALRKARLEYLETPSEERPSRMKYVYDQPVKSKSEDKDKKPATRSVVFSARRKSEEPTRRRKSTAVREERDAGSDGEYVYGKPEVDEKPKKKIENASKSQSSPRKTSSSKIRSGIAEVERQQPKRRHTEPVRWQDSCDEDEDTIVTIPAPQPLRRTSTLVSIPSRPSLKRSSTTAAVKTDVSLAKSTASAPRKPSGPLSFFSIGPPPPEPKVSCLTCGADDVRISRSAKLPCKHRMCHSCLRRIFKLSITDPAHMPPRCCTDQHISLKHVEDLFDMDFKKTFNRKYDEYKTKNRFYCINKNCGEWIRPKDITLEDGRKTGKCKKCGTRVCAICNNKAHKSRDCPKDPATKQFIETAKQKGWQKCFNCSAMVELKEGCNHMTCRCMAEFCMVCGLKWKGCDCPWFNYENVDAHLGNPVRYQEELDRRRDQEQRDEALARRMQALGVDENDPRRETFGLGNAAGHHMNANFMQLAREALTVNYQNAEQAARGLLNGWMTGRENPLPDGIPGNLDEINELLRGPSPGGPAADADLAPAPPVAPAVVPPQRRGTNRRRGVLDDLFTGGRSQTAEERDQERRIQDWANGVADDE